MDKSFKCNYHHVLMIDISNFQKMIIIGLIKEKKYSWIHFKKKKKTLTALVIKNKNANFKKYYKHQHHLVYCERLIIQLSKIIDINFL